MKQKATVGRIVHYVDGTAHHCAAIVSAECFTDNGPSGLHVFRPWAQPGQETYNVSASFNETPTPYTWHWPERE